ncbi:NAD(P)/FAD-dependent oxidoreductase [Streptomyces sp. UNOB3_S3]|uniref:FAD-dependent oxidoreductase n=1 Tax=Streptomyces sp. UNOB3_S3 TaxID=2871682 RepID=UPI001E4BCD5E|nr:NAD(P)/FAD-dependent oxidoreductase [Streptomyces sp. UNOB3_S3]MCC3777693.1 FAD-dependent monooxygenase [Streptomyces sp. UNOB3_S3]
MKFIIIGAGVSGVLSAVALTRAGHEVEVYERAERLRSGGNGVMVWHNGTAIMRDLGLRLDGLGRRIDRADVWSYDGRPLLRTDMAEIAGELGSHGMGVMRGRILERAVEALPEGTLRFGKECLRIREGGPGRSARVTVEFSDGTRAEGDVLIGADGYRSAVRQHLFGDDPARPTYLASWHGTTSVPIELESDHIVPTYYGKVGLCTVHPVGEGLTHWAFEVPWNGGARHLAAADGERAHEMNLRRAQVLRKLFGGWAGPVPQLLDVVKGEDIGVAPHVIHRVPRWWGRGPVTLAGDAAHAVPPRVGMGVNQALEDAWVLGQVFSGPGDPVASLRRYERVRRPRARRVRSRAVMMRRGNRMMLMMKATRDGLQSTKMLRSNIISCSNYLNGHVD